MMLGRRSFLVTAGGAAAGLLGGIPVGNRAEARASLLETQAPGFYRLPLGKFQITVVSDGTISFPCEALFPKAAKADLDAVLSDDFQPTDKFTLQTNVLVVNTGDQLVLIDTGSRGKFQPTAGRLLQNLASAEIRPDQVDMVLFTHLHPDHLWGVTDAGNAERTFPNAIYVIAEVEWNIWTQPQSPLAGDVAWGPVYHQNLKTLAAIKDRVRTVKPDGEVVTGITAVATPGHTPGHTSYSIASGSDHLLCAADVVGNRVISFQHPEWHGDFDYDLEQGAITRRAFLERCASERSLVSTYHLPFPGLGHVARAGTAFRWIPVDMQW
jgi:glyoxylase-like metal-dependent hydrolase (beta-lactamase superfamily II)